MRSFNGLFHARLFDGVLFNFLFGRSSSNGFYFLEYSPGGSITLSTVWPWQNNHESLPELGFLRHYEVPKLCMAQLVMLLSQFTI